MDSNHLELEEEPSPQVYNQKATSAKGAYKLDPPDSRRERKCMTTSERSRPAQSGHKTQQFECEEVEDKVQNLERELGKFQKKESLKDKRLKSGNQDASSPEVAQNQSESKRNVQAPIQQANLSNNHHHIANKPATVHESVENGEKNKLQVSDNSLKPRKGDSTPKSTNEAKEVTEKNFIQEAPVSKPLLSDPNKASIEANNQWDQANQEINGNNPTYPAHQTLNISKNQGPSNFSQYDVQQLSYELVKEYSHLKISKDENFMRRMIFDIFKRQTKEERLEKLIDKNKVTLDEEERIKGFNRLIEDANRRLEAQEKMEMMKNKLEEDLISPPAKKYKDKEWEEVYIERFANFQNEKGRKLDERIKQKQDMEREKEEEILELCKVKKAPMSVIDQSVKRLSEEAERRKIKMERRKKDYSQEDADQEKTDERESKELTPSKYQKFKNVEKYHFQSDNENYQDSDNEHQLKENRPQLLKKGTAYKPRNVTAGVSDKQNLAENKLKKKGKKFDTQTVTEFNNKRFTANETTSKPSIPLTAIKEEITRNKPKTNPKSKPIPEHSKKRMIPLSQDIDDIEKDFDNLLKVEKEKEKEKVEDEDEVRIAPKPMDEKTGENKHEMATLASSGVMVKDIKNLRSNKQTQDNSLPSKHYQLNRLYMKDHEANKIVNDIIEQFYLKNNP